MKTAVVIPARYGASRLPGKPLLPIENLPLVLHVVNQAQKCPQVHVCVATDDLRIYDAVKKHGCAVLMTSPACASGSDRVAEAVATLGPDFGYVVNVQGDEPFVSSEDIGRVVQALHEETSEMVTLASPKLSEEEFLSPHVVKVVCNNVGEAMFFSRAPIPYHRTSPKSAAQALRHVGIYGYQRGALVRFTQSKPHVLETTEQLEQLRALAMGMRIKVLITQHVARGIDTEEDLAWARAHVAQWGPKAFP
jgi:3-deoxy-manno-octulosonate cytidylyltransferase (CMP-KDO synthetase)